MKRSAFWHKWVMTPVLTALLLTTGCETNEGVSNDASVSRTVLQIEPRSAVVDAAAGQNVTFSVSGGKPEYRWQVANAELGTVTARGGQGVYSVSGGSGANFVVVTDAGGNSAGAQIIQGDVASSSLTISPAIATLPDGQTTATFEATGGQPGYRWSITETRLGALSAQGATAIYTRGPQAGAQFIRVTDSLGQRAEAVIIQEWPALRIEPGSLSMATNAPAQVFTVSGGSPAYRWNLADPALGVLSSSGASGIYTRGPIPGAQFIHVTDAAGNRVEAAIVQE